MNINDIVKKAEELGSYFVTITTRDKSKTEGDLTHYIFRKEFHQDDVNPSLDKCVRLLDIKLEKPVDVVKLEPLKEQKKPLNIAILSHFHKMPDSFSPARATKNQIKILKEHGHKITLFAQEGSVLDIGCEIKAVLPRFKMEKNIVNVEMKNKMTKVLQEHLPNYDLCITQDFYIDSLITYREALRNCGVDIPFIHFCRSGIGSPIDFKMPSATYVYLNYTDIGRFARKINADVKQCRTIFNEKEISYMFDFHPITRMIINKYQLWDRDIIQAYPMCSTRFDAKGINNVIKTFVELKRLGKKVCLIIANSNGRRRVQELEDKKKWAQEMGLNDDEFIFTSLLSTPEFDTVSEVPNQVCAELMQISNLFIFPSIAEVGPNVFLEACMTKNLIVANEDLPLLYDFVDKENVLSYSFTSSQSLHYTGRDNESLNKLAQQIVEQLDNNKADKTFRKVWKHHNSYSIYHDMLEPVLYENIK